MKNFLPSSCLHRWWLLLPYSDRFIVAAWEQRVRFSGIGQTQHGACVAGEGLGHRFRLGLGIPDFDRSIGRACDHEQLVEDLFCQDAFDFSLVGVGQVGETPSFVLFAVSQALNQLILTLLLYFWFRNCKILPSLNPHVKTSSCVEKAAHRILGFYVFGSLFSEKCEPFTSATTGILNWFNLTSYISYILYSIQIIYLPLILLTFSLLGTFSSPQCDLIAFDWGMKESSLELY